MKKYEGYYIRQFNNLCKMPSKLIKRGKIAYFEEFLTLDTETSHIPYNYDNFGRVVEEDTLTWIYQFAICSHNALYTGRNGLEILEFYNNLIETNDINENVRLVTYIHNASYDLSYLMPFFNEVWGIPKVIATSTHKIISLSYDNGLTFKCSYKLSNQSLEKWCDNLGTQHKKLVGFVDYNEVHFQDGELTEKDWYYQFNDVICLRECLLKQFEIYGHNVATTPLTSTGYIREMAFHSYKNAIKQYGNNIRQQFIDSALSVEAYNICCEEMSGGITHGNRFLANKIVTPKGKWYIKHRDFDSHYPTNQICHDKGYPIGKFTCYYKMDKLHQLSMRDVLNLTGEYCVMVKLLIKDLCLKDRKTSLPYAQYSHFTRKTSEGIQFVTDNGRILKYDGICEVIVNEIDLKWLLKQYKFTYIIKEVWTSKKGNLPQWLTDVIKDLYKKKTDYKNKIKEAKKQGLDTFEMEIELLRVKALLNSIYGMTATDPIKETFELDDIGNWTCNHEKQTDVGEMLARYYKGKKNCMRFEWGCYTTAYARNELMEFYELITKNGGIFLYADTDSIFYISNVDVETIINNKNKEFEEQSMKMRWYVTLDNGKIKTFNRFDDENDDIRSFKFLHAKCYGMYCGDDNKLECTVAGVPKRILENNGYFYREDELQTLDNMKQDFTFKKCGGNECRYYVHIPKERYYNNHKIITGGGAIINNTTKTLSQLDFANI